MKMEIIITFSKEKIRVSRNKFFQSNVFQKYDNYKFNTIITSNNNIIKFNDFI